MACTLRWLRTGRPENASIGRLEHGWRVKAFSIAAFVGLPVCVVVVAAVAGPKTQEAVAGWLTGLLLCAAMTAFLVVRAHSATTFDDEGVRVLSPLRKPRALRWRDVRIIRWGSTGLLVLSDGGRTVMRIAPGFAGTRAFANECVSHVPSAVVSRDADAQAALDLMRAGLSHALVMAQARPSVILAAYRQAGSQGSVETPSDLRT
jgi:hypothetical protein